VADPELRRPTMNARAILIVAVGLVLVGLPLRAEEAANKHDPRVAFKETDANLDGVIDHAEFQQRMTEVFFSADRNKDGFLDPTELKQLAFPEDFTAEDKDKNGRVSTHEFFRVRFHDYDLADTDHDGELSLDEVVAAFEGKRR
jgi:Ca2+-binding EF-hand superfamily protein